MTRKAIQIPFRCFSFNLYAVLSQGPFFIRSLCHKALLSYDFVVGPFCHRALLSRPFLRGHFVSGPFGKAFMSPDVLSAVGAVCNGPFTFQRPVIRVLFPDERIAYHFSTPHRTISFSYETVHGYSPLRHTNTSRSKKKL